ncbi:YheE family protein [Bacillus sp. B15-48]|uniref:YheE family protein n=1 Tax=Bacillus sp. B15-48 TaxID=1548601 RepID=UPI00193F4747|nr:YheE family protein [Bacillus sp. B15-48]MBM4764104.1 hypothetical protein [Bacillus sp. B15-48]
MLTHFQYKSLYKNADIPGWLISFYFNKQQYRGIYHQNGKIEWTGATPDSEDIQQLEKQIHELMLYHVYE